MTVSHEANLVTAGVVGGLTAVTMQLAISFGGPNVTAAELVTIFLPAACAATAYVSAGGLSSSEREPDVSTDGGTDQSTTGGARNRRET